MYYTSYFMQLNDYIVKNINPLIITNNNTKKQNNTFTYFNNIPKNIQYNIDKYSEFVEHMSKKYNYINLEKLCIDYISSLHWIKDSYFNGKINNWIYKSIFSPLLSQLYNVINDNIKFRHKRIATKIIRFYENYFNMLYLLINKDYNPNEISHFFGDKIEEYFIKFLNLIEKINN